MKKYYLSLVLFLCAAIVTVSASELSTAKRNLKSAQKELSSAISKRDKAQQKQIQLQADSVEALAEIEKYQDKPKSLAYKNAIKDSESTNEKLVNIALQLTELNNTVDSLTTVVSNCELALNQAQQSEIDAKEKNQFATDPETLTNQNEMELAQSKAAEEEESDVLPNDQTNDNRGTETAESSDVAIKDTDTEEESEKDMSVWIGGIFIVLLVWAFIDIIRKKYHCPECGKWFTMEFDGDTRVWDHDTKGKITRRGARKKYVCSNCGHVTKYISWFRS